MCELVGLFSIKKVTKIFAWRENDLYRENGKVILNSTPCPIIEQKKKTLVHLLEDDKIKVTVDSNLVQTDSEQMLHSISHLENFGLSEIQRQTTLISAMSNYPPFIKKQIPAILSQRLTDLFFKQRV